MQTELSHGDGRILPLVVLLEGPYGRATVVLWNGQTTVGSGGCWRVLISRLGALVRTFIAQSTGWRNGEWVDGSAGQRSSGSAFSGPAVEHDTSQYVPALCLDFLILS